MTNLKVIAEKREQLVEHLLEKGWMVNYKYIEQKKKEVTKHRKSKSVDDRNHKNNDVDFNILIRGEYQGDYHLISQCEKYTVRITKTTANFWKIKNWTQLGEYYIDEIELTDNGIKMEIVNIELSDAQ